MKGLNMNITKSIIASLFLVFSGFASADGHKVTMQYGGDWTGTAMVANGDYLSMSGAFVGSNEMVMANGDVLITNYVCPGIYHEGEAIGSCKMKQAGSQDFWVLSWKCDPEFNCTGEVMGGTGRFAGATGSLAWKDNSGFGKGGGTFNLK